MRKNLKLFRVEKDLTQTELATLTGVSVTTYWNIESGKSRGSMRFWMTLKNVYPEIDIAEMEKVEGARA